VPPSDQPRARTTTADSVDPARPGRIIVADDDRLARELLADILTRAGHTVEAVDSGQLAVERAAQGGVDMVLLDVLMPRLSGIEACRLLKSMVVDTFLPVILVTAKTDTQSRVEGLRIGADDYVCKPFEEAELVARVAAMLRIKRLHEQLTVQKARFERLSVHDELTGLYNFRFLHTRLNEEFKRAERYHEPFACALIDVDQLRAVNDVGGRVAGDAALRRVAEGIKRCVREVDVVARYGGDEFLVVMPSTHFAGSVVVAERIWRETSGRVVEIEPSRDPAPSAPKPRVAVAAAADSSRSDGERRNSRPPPADRSDGPPSDPRWADGPRQINLSIGVALYPSRDVRTKDALIRAAEAALSQAKREGGNRICVFQQQGYIYSPAIAPDPPRRGAQPADRPKAFPDPPADLLGAGPASTRAPSRMGQVGQAGQVGERPRAFPDPQDGPPSSRGRSGIDSWRPSPESEGGRRGS
jgi:two-component system, cell cycle response regulator